MKKILMLLLLPSLILLGGCNSDNGGSGGTNTYSSLYNCSSNSYNCDDFSTHSEAQRVYQYCGGVSNDVHQLDRDGDGSACETLP